MSPLLTKGDAPVVNLLGTLECFLLPGLCVKKGSSLQGEGRCGGGDGGLTGQAQTKATAEEVADGYFQNLCVVVRVLFTTVKCSVFVSLQGA